jgi:hypothetical protein
VHLAQGFHPIEVVYFENHGYAGLTLSWRRPGEATLRVIPEGFFYAPRELTDLPVPQVDAVATKDPEIGGEIEISGASFGTNERLVRVMFPGDIWVRPAKVDPERIRVRVPYGTEEGELRVGVGVHRSNAVRFTPVTAAGLTADYATFVDRAALEAALADDSFRAKQPNVRRVESSWQRDAAKDWDLPFPAQSTFLIHWHGTLAVEYATDVDWILRAAAGAWIEIDGKRVADNPPWHELAEKYGLSQLTPGEHRFDLWLVQSGAEPRLQLLYTPAGIKQRLPVPGRWFLPREPR